MPDPKTALIFLISTSAISGFVVLILWKLHRDLHGLGIVAVSSLLLCMTFASLLDRSVPSIVFHNTLAMAAQFTLSEGLLVFLGGRAAWRLLALLVAGTATSWTLMMWLVPENMPLRVTIITLLGVAICARFVSLLIRRRERLGVAEWVMISAFTLHMVLQLARMVLSLAHPDPSFVWTSAILGWSFLEMCLVTLLVFFSVLLMVGTRLAGDLQRHSSALATERRMKSELRQLLHMLGHELHTPLAVITRSSEAIRAQCPSPAPAELEHHISTLQTTAERLNRLARNLLTAERADMDQPQPDILDLATLTNEAADLLTGKWGPGRLRIAVTTASALVMGDRSLLFTAIINLMDNALKYSPPATYVQVEIEEADAEIILRVRDRGIGFPPAQIAQLGQRFFRAENAKTHSGTGLGLYMAKTIAQRHGGRLELSNADDLGAQVTLTLPAA